MYRSYPLQGFDDLWTDNQFLLNDQHTSIIIINSWVVGAWGYGHQVIRKSFNGIWADWMGTNHHAKVISFQESIQIIWTKVYNVILLLRISYCIMLEAILFFSLMWITPEKIYYSLVIFSSVRSKFNLKWSLNLIDAWDILNCWTNTSMAAKNSLLFISYNGS